MALEWRFCSEELMNAILVSKFDINFPTFFAEYLEKIKGIVFLQPHFDAVL